MNKNITILLGALCCAFGARAEGFQVNMLSAKQTGMGHMGAAMKLGAESMHFNPAGLAFMNKTIELSGGFSAIQADAEYEGSGANDGYYRKSNNSLSTPVFAYAGFRIYDNLKAGISVTTPYGSSMNWAKNWRGAELVQDISLRAFVVQPTLSYRITDRLSVGAGLMVAKGSVELSKGLLPVGFLTAMGMGSEYADVVPLGVTLNGTSKFGYGYNLGIQYDVCSKLTLGFSFRSKMNMEVEDGDIKLNMASDAIAPMVPPLNEGTFHAELPLPYNWNIGLAYQPTDRWIVSAEYQRIGWSAYKSLDVEFNETALRKYNIYTHKGYSDTYILRLGAQYAVTGRFDVRAGVYYDTTPVDKNNYNPETPGMTKVGISAGFSFRPIENLSIDFAMLIIQGLGIDGSCTYTNSITQQQSTFEGHYEAFAYAPSIGLSYAF